MQKLAGDYVISPYIREVPADVISLYVHSESHLQNEPCLLTGDHVLVDDMNRRIVIVPTRIWRLMGLERAKTSCEPPWDPSPSVTRLSEEAGLIVSRDSVGKRHAYQSLEIEVNTHCNFRCEFCPVRDSPKQRHIMPLALYETILERAHDYGITQISLNHYSEPTLNPFLVRRVGLAAEMGICVELYTNGSGLSPVLLDAVASTTPDISLVVSFPAADPQQYASVTASECYQHVVSNVRHALNSPIPVTITVNAPLHGRSEAIQEVSTIFGIENQCGVIAWDTDDRAGRLVLPAYAMAHKHGDVLRGCLLALQNLNVGYDGKAFLCAQDYDKEYVLGDLSEQSIGEIVESERAVSLRQAIFGVIQAPRSLLCRRCAWTVSLGEKADVFTIGNKYKLTWNVKHLSKLFEDWPILRLSVSPYMDVSPPISREGFLPHSECDK